jgi:exoribonuclease II
MRASAKSSAEWLKDIARRAMSNRGLLPDFSLAAQAQASALRVSSKDASLPDLRHLAWVSIDNDDSRDLDQISVAEAHSAGATRMRVAIADVDALLQPGSAIDEHAHANTTSVYTVPMVFPMLPEILSTNLTSLAEGQDRIAIVVDMMVRSDGTLGDASIYRAQVRNYAKLTYRAVGEWLSGSGPPPAGGAPMPGLEPQLRLQDGVAQALRGVRDAHGALSLESLEPRPIFSGGLLSDLQPQQKNRAHELIEDLMIAANGVTARYLAAHRAPSLRRVLRTPKRWDRIVALATEMGDVLPDAPSAVALSEFLARRHAAHPESFADLSLCVIKLLGRGEYVLEVPGEAPIGHFGLAVSDYTHSTAPNRRFPDLVTQRLVKAALAGRAPVYGTVELRTLAAHCTVQEDNASKVERQVAKSAAAFLLRPRIGRQFDAIVTGAADKGTWVRISNPTIEGRLMTGFEGLQVGDRVTVKLLRVDVERGYIDFERS